MNRTTLLVLVVACAAPLPLCACLGPSSRSLAERPRETVRLPVQPASGSGAQAASTLILGVN